MHTCRFSLRKKIFQAVFFGRILAKQWISHLLASVFGRFQTSMNLNDIRGPENLIWSSSAICVVYAPTQGIFHPTKNWRRFCKFKGYLKLTFLETWLEFLPILSKPVWNSALSSSVFRTWTYGIPGKVTPMSDALCLVFPERFSL